MSVATKLMGITVSTAVYFADTDPIFALAEHAKEPIFSVPDPQTRVTNAQFRRQAAFRLFPWRPSRCYHGDVTTGALGFVKFGDRKWHRDEINALTVVATIFAHVQARLNVEDQLRYQHDLTALPNRPTLLAHLDYRLIEGRAGPVPVLLSNLNRLKAHHA
jgi:hypothetical protein